MKTLAKITPPLRWLLSAFAFASIALVSLFLANSCMNEPPGIIVPCKQPKGLHTSPAKGDTGVPLDPVITVTFDTLKNPASFDSTSIILVHGNDTIGGTTSYNPTDTTLSFTPTDSLKPNTPYIVTVTVPTDSTIPNPGGPLGPPITVDTTYTWTFTTQDTLPPAAACVAWLPQSPVPASPGLGGVTLRSVFFGNTGSHSYATQIVHIREPTAPFASLRMPEPTDGPRKAPRRQRRQPICTPSTVRLARMEETATCYAVGANGTILSNASAMTPGTTWSTETENPAITSTLRSVFCGSLSSNLCIAVGDGGTILRKTTSGGPWVKYTASPTAQQLSSVSCMILSYPDVQANYMCYAAGNNGTFLKSMDLAEATWALIPVPGFSTVNFNSVYLWPVPVGVAWMAGDNGTLLITEDSAATWTALAPGTGTAALNSVDFGGNKDVFGPWEMEASSPVSFSMEWLPPPSF